MVPHLAEALSDVVPIDLAVIERGIQDILGQIDSLAGKIADDATTSRATLTLALLVVLAAGALLLLDARKSGAGPMVVFNAVNSSWSWVLGAATRSGRSFRCNGEP